MKFSFLRWTVFLALCLAAFPARAEELPKFEIVGGLNLVFPGFSGTYTSQYSPPFPFVEHISSAQQTLTLDGQRGYGFEAGFNVFPTPRVGFQVLADFFRADLCGANSPYPVSLSYTAGQPPDNIPRPFTYDRTLSWPDTEGSVKELALAFNVVLRWRLEGAVRGTVSGGPGYFNIRGNAAPLGYTNFRLGGHSVLFPETYGVGFAIDPVAKLGINVGGDVNVRLVGNLSFRADYRYFRAGETTALIRITGPVNPEEVLFPQTVAEIEAALAPRPLTFNPSFWRVVFGITLGL